MCVCVYYKEFIWGRRSSLGIWRLRKDIIMNVLVTLKLCVSNELLAVFIDSISSEYTLYRALKCLKEPLVNADPKCSMPLLMEIEIGL